MKWLFIFITAAALEVGGDAMIRAGLRGRGALLILAGFLALGTYGLVVNLVKWDFSRLMGMYVALFAVVSVVVSLLVFKETIQTGTWTGLFLIVAGGLVIQLTQSH